MSRKNIPIRPSVLQKRLSLFDDTQAVKLFEIHQEGIKDLRFEQDGNWLSLIAIMEHGQGASLKRKHERIPVTLLNPDDFDFEIPDELEGFRPTNVPVRFVPKGVEPLRIAVDDSEDRDVGGTIFGTDDRYLFND